ncbi:MarR family winged helix-turn-helix transcriptional regulator [Demequina lutea]|uniref:DNA-binding MarR family transcriptional regulator n=1 Tax=Demequina lutea TaxID=431489 RepID=A0A7Y9ZA82_9MICO|nr:MarR family winged helix-turn-helix transcriptional regulator [Demequina lutea]NYI41679.1 DNA-binding MarR family transcriptional regulator [Demequina lutea]
MTHDAAVAEGGAADAGVASAAELAGSLRTVVGRLSHQLRVPAASQGVTPTRLSALIALERAGVLRPSVLAASLGITPASTSRLVESLESEAWVNRGVDPDDGRACLLSLTAEGSAMLARLRSETDSMLADDLAALAPEARRTLADALPVLIELADRWVAPTRDE